MTTLLPALNSIFARPGFAGLSADDLADLGFSRTDLALLTAIHPGAHARMSAMAARFGLTLEEVLADPDRAAETTARCGDCAYAGQCKAALAGAALFPGGECPNSETYLKLAAGE